MYSFRSYIICILFLWPLMVMSQSHDFEVRDFHENVTDLTAVTSNVKDLNGVAASLIRFAVRDTLFTFDANLGIIKQKNVVGEILLYVPVSTKRLTIRHPNLGILRDYQLPVSIKSKTTYDAEIVITNADYLRSLYGYEQRPAKEEPAPIVVEDPKVEEPKVEKPKEEKPSYMPDDIYQPKVKQDKSLGISKSHFMIGGGFNALNAMGPMVTVGLEVGKLSLSADYTMGLEKVEGVAVYYKYPGYDGGGLGEAYDYSVSRLTARLGLNLSSDATFQVVPQVGVSVNMIKGDEIVNELGSDSQFSKATPLSLFAALNLRVRLFNPLYLSVTPHYNFIVGKDEVYDVIKDADSKIKAWGEGFGVSAGLLLRF